MKRTKRTTGDQSIASTDTTSLVIHYVDENVNEKKSKRMPKQSSTSSTNKNVTIPVKRTKKKPSNISQVDLPRNFFFF